MSSNSKNKKVLVVEDELAIAKLIKYVLENSNFEVTLVHEGKDALEKVKTFSPDIMVLDLMLPVMSGFEILEYLGDKKLLDDLPVIVLTCRGQEEDKVKAMRLGASEFMTKPFSPSGLVAVLNSILNKSGGIHGE
ncbi:MAG: response regulator [Caldisericia bacterium]|nr:response regulator [Caldisericia bacterium]